MNFVNCGLDDFNDLRQLSRTAYIEAFYDLLDRNDVIKYVDNKYSTDNLKKELQDPCNHFLFCYMSGKMAGYMKYILKPISLEIDRLYMLKSFKGIGAGSAFMNKAEALAMSNQKKFLTLGVLEKNTPAIAFYKNKGFWQYGRETVKVGNNVYHLLLMKKELH